MRIASVCSSEKLLAQYKQPPIISKEPFTSDHTWNRHTVETFEIRTLSDSPLRTHTSPPKLPNSQTPKLFQLLLEQPIRFLPDRRWKIMPAIRMLRAEVLQRTVQSVNLRRGSHDFVHAAPFEICVPQRRVDKHGPWRQGPDE